MKKIVITYISALLINLSLNAQMVDLDKGRTQSIRFENFYGNLTIEGSKTNRILIEKTKSNRVPEIFKETIKSSSYKKNNIDLKLHFDNKGNKLIISPSDLESQFADYQVKIPYDMIVKIINSNEQISNKDWSDGDIQAGFSTQNISIKKCSREIELLLFLANVNMLEITGPFTCTVFKGDINISYSKFTAVSPSAIALFSGNVEIKLPKETNCNVGLLSSTGNINSEFDIKDVILNSSGEQYVNQVKKGSSINKKAVFNSGINGQINKGGTEINVSIFTGDVSILKK